MNNYLLVFKWSSSLKEAVFKLNTTKIKVSDLCLYLPYNYTTNCTNYITVSSLSRKLGHYREITDP